MFFFSPIRFIAFHCKPPGGSGAAAGSRLMTHAYSPYKRQYFPFRLLLALIKDIPSSRSFFSDVIIPSRPYKTTGRYSRMFSLLKIHLWGTVSMIALGLLILSQFPLLPNYETIFESHILIKTWLLTFLCIALY